MNSGARISILRAALMLLGMLLPCCSSGQTTAAAPSDANQQVTSIGDALRRSVKDPVHILYIHGIGATGAYDSSELRVSICKALKDCIVMGGEAVGREYADQGVFAPDHAAPDLTYMGQPLWASQEEWRASAPFVDHYVIRLKRGKNILLDELNWWPMVFSLKCRNMLPNEMSLAGRDAGYLSLCSQRKEHNSDGITGRFDTYAWITPEQAAQLNSSESKGLILNRKLKVNLLDWRISDALLGVGPLEKYLVEGTRQLLMKCVSTAAATTANLNTTAPMQQAAGAEYIAISHSLGSFLIFSALHLEYTSPTGSLDGSDPQRAEVFNYLLGHLSQAYFFANQIPLLELAKLESGEDTKAFLDLKNWADQRAIFMKNAGSSGTQPLVQIVAWSDPNDILTWYLGEDFQRWQANDNGVRVVNRLVKNAPRWFGALEGPTSAHDYYDKNREVIRELLKPLQP